MTSGGVDLSLSAVLLLSACDCSTTRFGEAYNDASVILPSNSITSFYNDDPIYVTVNIDDSVSTVCGNQDGLTFCSHRSFSIINKATGLEETTLLSH